MTSTIEEVVRTLVIAFVLVGIVVFLFLGKLRTTLIPLIAVPVSIIGTFAVMLMIGYSAKRCRCSRSCWRSVSWSTMLSW